MATAEQRIEMLEYLIRRAAPFVNACVVVAEDKTNGLAWLADASMALDAADYDARVAADHSTGGEA